MYNIAPKNTKLWNFSEGTNIITILLPQPKKTTIPAQNNQLENITAGSAPKTIPHQSHSIFTTPNGLKLCVLSL